MLNALAYELLQTVDLLTSDQEANFSNHGQ